MKILHVLGDSTGGIRQHVAKLTHELSQREIDSEIVGPHDVMKGLAEQKYSFDKPSLSHPFATFRSIRTVKKAIGECDIIHVHGVTAALLVYCAQLGTSHRRPVVITMHNIAFKALAGKKYRPKKIVQNFILSRADAVICPSKFTVRQLKLTPSNERKCSVILPVGRALSSDEKKSARENVAGVRKAYGVENDLVLFCLARIDPQKDFTTLLAAFSLVRQKDAHVKLLIAGGGTKSRIDVLNDMISDLGIEGSVDVLGYVDAPDDLIAASDIMVLSSLYETVPLVVLEALQLGVPVVMTETGIAQEILKDDCGTYVPVGNAQALARAIETWCERVRANTIDHQALESVADSWVDPQACVQPVIDIYSTLVQNV